MFGPSARNPSRGSAPVEGGGRPLAGQRWHGTGAGSRVAPRCPGLSTGELVALRSSLVLKSLPRNDLETFLTECTIHRMASGQTLYREGGPAGHGIWLIAAGVVRVDVRNASGEDVPVRKLKPGDHFGEIGFFGRRPHSATIVAEVSAKMVGLDRMALTALIARDPRVEEVLRRSYHRRAVSPEEVDARGGIDALL